VERHAGQVQAISAGAGTGSEFVLRLPRLKEGGRADAGSRPSRFQRAGANCTRRILIVDDNRDAAESMAILLQMSGHEVVVVTDGPSALAAVATQQPDLVLLDIGLPGMNGYEVARRLRGGGCSSTLVALTGYGQADDQQRSRDAGIDHHFVKPMNPGVLDALLG
jgi:CheY-like chemotaxis protein